jgi:hypothetical protein
MRKLDTLVADFPDTYSLIGQDEVSKTYSFPKSYISYRKPRKVSFEQKELARKQIKKINSKKLYVCAENDDKIRECNAKLTT